jgi:NTP pyrophosphatase (non-canonical NTP hydrolase)
VLKLLRQLGISSSLLSAASANDAELVSEPAVAAVATALDTGANADSVANPNHRHVLVHYHLFKNGGSSIERMLSDSYGERWATYDKPESGARISAEEMQAFLERQPELSAVSSHQLVPPLPFGRFQVTPILFLRHPLVRVKSAYLFEWKKQLGLDEAKGSLSEYIEEKFKNRDSSVIANFQVSRLNNNQYDNPRQPMGRHSPELLNRSKQLIDELPFFGLVERFGESLEWMRRETREHFPELDIREYHENALQSGDAGIGERTESLRAEIGDTLFDELCLRNSFDLQLYSYAEGRFQAVMDIREQYHVC